MHASSLFVFPPVVSPSSLLSDGGAAKQENPRLLICFCFLFLFLFLFLVFFFCLFVCLFVLFCCFVVVVCFCFLFFFFFLCLFFFSFFFSFFSFFRCCSLSVSLDRGSFFCFLLSSKASFVPVFQYFFLVLSPPMLCSSFISLGVFSCASFCCSFFFYRFLRFHSGFFSHFKSLSSCFVFSTSLPLHPPFLFFLLLLSVCPFSLLPFCVDFICVIISSPFP